MEGTAGRARSSVFVGCEVRGELFEYCDRSRTGRGGSDAEEGGGLGEVCERVSGVREGRMCRERGIYCH